jgi:SAM-dependent methyltransferase
MALNVLPELTAVENELLAVTTRLSAVLTQPHDVRDRAAIAEYWDRCLDLRRHHDRSIAVAPQWEAGATIPGGDMSVVMGRRDLLRAARWRAGQWHKVAELLGRQANARAQQLITTRPVHPSGAEDGLVTNLMRALHMMANPTNQQQVGIRDSGFPDLGLSGEYFANLMQAAYRISLALDKPRPLRFLDVGCGGGTKVFGAASFFERAEGLEFDSGYLAAAQWFLDRVHAPQTRVYQADAQTFEKYGDYDVVYLYRPLRRDGDLANLEARIIEQVKPGTIIVAPYVGFKLDGANPAAPRVAESVHVAHFTQDQADALRKRAEMIGPDVRLESPRLEADWGFWRPLLVASRQNGYALR